MDSDLGRLVRPPHTAAAAASAKPRHTVSYAEHNEVQKSLDSKRRHGEKEVHTAVVVVLFGGWLSRGCGSSSKKSWLGRGVAVKFIVAIVSSVMRTRFVLCGLTQLQRHSSSS